MGYDMKIVGSVTEVPPGYEPQYEGQAGYHRLNIHWMPVVRELMQRAGALDDYGEGLEPLPEWPPDGLDVDRAEALVEYLDEYLEAVPASEPPPPLDPPITPDEQALMARYEEQRQRVLAAPSHDDGKVAYWKFCSNDGWLVSPAECDIIVSTLTTAIDEDDDELWAGIDRDVDTIRTVITAWIAFVRLAGRHGGFRVD